MDLEAKPEKIHVKVEASDLDQTYELATAPFEHVKVEGPVKSESHSEDFKEPAIKSEPLDIDVKALFSVEDDDLDFEDKPDLVSIDSGDNEWIPADSQPDQRGGKGKPRRRKQAARPYTCPLCTYRGKTEEILQEHCRAIHKDGKVRIFKCPNCDYQTKYKASLAYHMLRYKAKEEVRMYRCTGCDYQSNHKSNLNKHMLIHKSPAEVRKHPCDRCPFSSKTRAELRQHMIVHTESEDLSCSQCSFRTKRRAYLESHMVMHDDPSRVRMYECADCGFRSKFSAHLKRHLLTHKNNAEVELFDCTMCDFQSKYKNSMARHVALHGKYGLPAKREENTSGDT